MTRKVLLITNVFPPAIGGPATFAARLGQRLTEDGYHARVFCATPAPAEFDTRFQFRVTRAGVRGNRLRREIELRARLLTAVAHADFVYCMGLEHQAHWAVRTARKRYTIRIGGDSVWERARNSGVTRLDPEDFYKDSVATERAAVHIEDSRRLVQLRDASAIVYVSNYLKNLARAWAGERAPAEYIVRNGIDAANAGGITKRQSGQMLRVLFVGRQTNWKGVDAALLALCRVEKTSLTVAGSGPAWPAHVDLARRLGMSNRTEFLHSVDSRGVIDLMKSHHVLVLPSLYEGLSNTLLEAGIAGLACVASNRGGNPEVIEHEVTGLLVDPYNVNELAGALTRLRNDESCRATLAERHQRRVRDDFHLTGSIRQTIDILEGKNPDQCE